MNYMFLFDEYKKLCLKQIETINKIALLPEGYISEKMISGKKYCYLQKRVASKTVSVYVKASEIAGVRKQIEKRKQLEKKKSEVVFELTKIEKAAEILCYELYERILLYKKCFELDCLSAEERQIIDTFSSAMLSIEGESLPSYAQSEFDKWVTGKQSFSDGYSAVLKKFNLIGV